MGKEPEVKPGEKIPGTDIINQPTPDSEKEKLKNLSDAFDSDFEYLLPEELRGKKNDEGGTPSPEQSGVSPASAASPKKGESQEPPVIDSEGVLRDAEVSRLKGELEASRSEINSLKAANTEIAEFKKEPLLYLQKNFPELARQINPQNHILSILHKEFGPDFKYEPSDAYTEGTQSYKWRLRELELRDNLVRESDRIEQDRVRSQKENEARLITSRDKVMKTYHLNEQQFNDEIVKWSQSKVLDFEDMARLKFFDQIVKNLVDKALARALKRKNGEQAAPAASVADIHGDSGGDESSEGYREHQSVFGDV